MSPEHDPADLDTRTWGRPARSSACSAPGRSPWSPGGRCGTCVSQPLDLVSNALPEPVREALPFDGWRIYAVNPPMPDFDPTRFRLQVTGLVDRDLDLAWSEVQGLPRVAQVSDFHCVTGWSVRRRALGGLPAAGRCSTAPACSTRRRIWSSSRWRSPTSTR